jgi:Putative Actinobacterial Holin-X, holin superfamily III
MPNRSIADIFTDVIDQFTILLSKEGQLARTELSEKITQVAVALGLVVGGSVLLTPALVILLQAGVSALITNNIVGEPWAPLIVGGVVLVIGIILLSVGMSRLKAEALVPNKTINQIQSDVRVAKQQVLRESYDHQRAA